MLSPEQNAVLDAYNEMFATEGWKMFVKDLKENQDSIAPNLLNAPVTMEDLYFLKGRNDVYNSVLGLQALMENVKKQLEFDQNE